MCHPIGRIDFAPRDNPLWLRQIESGSRQFSPRNLIFDILAPMAAPDPILGQIAARFDHLDVVKNRGGYTLCDRQSEQKVARLRPCPDSDGFELFYWSLTHERWRPFGPLGPMELTLDEAREITGNESIFQPPRRSWISRIFS